MTKLEKNLHGTLNKLQKCSGDCLHCEKFHVYTASTSNALYMAYGCDLLPVDSFGAISDSVKSLKADAIETAEFELS